MEKELRFHLAYHLRANKYLRTAKSAYSSRPNFYAPIMKYIDDIKYMRRILICAPYYTAKKLEDRLRYKFDVEIKLISPSDICEIKGKIRREWITICRFADNENLKDVLTMFGVNYELKMTGAAKNTSAFDYRE